MPIFNTSRETMQELGLQRISARRCALRSLMTSFLFEYARDKTLLGKFPFFYGPEKQCEFIAFWSIEALLGRYWLPAETTRISISPGHPLSELTYCFGHSWITLINKILASIFAAAFAGKTLSHARISFLPRESRKS